MAIELRELRANRLTFRCREVGFEGEPAILLHGFAETSRVWVPLLTALETRGLRALAPDQRGYSPGARPRGAQHYRFGSLASDALALADGAGFGRIHLVGHGLGARVAWTAAQRAPERVASAALLSLRSAEAIAKEPDAERALAASDFAQLRTQLAGRGADDLDEILDVLRQPGALVAACHWHRANHAPEGDPPPKVDPRLLLLERDPGDCALEVCAHLRAHPL